MRNLLSAEWTKLLPHRGTWLLVWIYPILLTAILAIGIAVKLASPAPGEAMSAGGWIDHSAAIWYVPGIAFGRYLIAAYFALIFAGEYGWNTWKLIVPHCARWKLVAAKYATGLALLYLAWFAAAAIAVALDLFRSAALGEPIPAGVTAGAIVHGHFTLLVQGIAPLLLTAAYASLAAVLTRSALAAFIVSIVLITIDQSFGMLVRVLSSFGMEWLSFLYQVLPGYHLENLTHWLREGAGLQVRLAGGTLVAWPPTMSFLALGAWIVGLAALVFAAFRRQDIN